MRIQVLFLASLGGLRIQHCHEPWYRSPTWLRSGVAVAALWCRLAAAALIRPLAGERPHVTRAAVKIKTKNKNKNKTSSLPKEIKKKKEEEFKIEMKKVNIIKKTNVTKPHVGHDQLLPPGGFPGTWPWSPSSSSGPHVAILCAMVWKQASQIYYSVVRDMTRLFGHKGQLFCSGGHKVGTYFAACCPSTGGCHHY